MQPPTSIPRLPRSSLRTVRDVSKIPSLQKLGIPAEVPSQQNYFSGLGSLDYNYLMGLKLPIMDLLTACDSTPELSKLCDNQNFASEYLPFLAGIHHELPISAVFQHPRLQRDGQIRFLYLRKKYPLLGDDGYPAEYLGTAEHPLSGFDHLAALQDVIAALSADKFTGGNFDFKLRVVIQLECVDLVAEYFVAYLQMIDETVTIIQTVPEEAENLKEDISDRIEEVTDLLYNVLEQSNPLIVRAYVLFLISFMNAVYPVNYVSERIWDRIGKWGEHNQFCHVPSYVVFLRELELNDYEISATVRGYLRQFFVSLYLDKIEYAEIVREINRKIEEKLSRLDPDRSEYYLISSEQYAWCTDSEYDEIFAFDNVEQLDDLIIADSFKILPHTLQLVQPTGNTIFNAMVLALNHGSYRVLKILIRSYQNQDIENAVQAMANLINFDDVRYFVNIIKQDPNYSVTAVVSAAYDNFTRMMSHHNKLQMGLRDISLDEYPQHLKNVYQMLFKYLNIDSSDIPGELLD